MKPAPAVVRCEWKEIDVNHLITSEDALESIQSTVVYEEYPGCLGHLYQDPQSNAYPMLSGFARGGGENSYGDMEKEGIASKCYGKLATKHGIPRKQNNGTNSMRKVASPSIGIEFGAVKELSLINKGWIEVPTWVLEKVRFLRRTDLGMYYLSKLRIGEAIVIGRCPSQGPDSAIPLKVKAAPNGINACAPLENAEFDGGEVYGLVPIMAEGIGEAKDRWHKRWIVNRPEPIFEEVFHVAVENDMKPRELLQVQDPTRRLG
ncbi:hypothetical protein OQA88_13269 [Cercophora sp. LCS_1]